MANGESTKRVACGCVAAAVAACPTNPLETLRVRWQVLSLAKQPTGTATSSRGGVSNFAMKIVREQGLLRGLCQPGAGAWTASLGSAFGMRMAMFEPVRAALETHSGMDRGVSSAAAAGLFTGAFSNALSCPLFNVKTRLQADMQMRKGANLFTELAVLTKEGGIASLYRGAGMLFIRGGLIAAGSLAGYTKSKAFFVSQGMSDSPVMHVAASAVAAGSQVVLSSPADVVVNRYQAGPQLGQKFSSAWACAKHLVLKEGPRSLFRGMVPCYARALPTSLIIMPLYEHLRYIAGLDYLA